MRNCHTVLLNTGLLGVLMCFCWGDAIAFDENGCEVRNIQQPYIRPVPVSDTSVPRACRTTTLNRNYILCIPPALRAQSATDQKLVPLVLAFHGAGENSSGESFQRKVSFEIRGTVDGFISAYPNGCQLEAGAIICEGGNWNAQGNPARGVSEVCKIDDVAFVSKIIADIKTVYSKINMGKIFAFGHSKGGVFSYSLACDMPSTFNAIGVTAGTQTDASCTKISTTGYPAVFHVHNLQDNNVPFLGGGSEFDWPPAEVGLQFWATRNGCTLSTGDHDFSEFMCLEANCQSKSVELCLLGTDILDGLGADPTNPASPHRYETYDGAFTANQGRSIRDAFVDKFFR
jgi:poly(3-hydroxybutyrate) depolymerase